MHKKQRSICILSGTHFRHTMSWPKRRRATSTAQSSGGTSVPDPTNPPETRVDAGISTTDYARRRRELMDMMADLRDMGWVLSDLIADILLAHAISYSADALIDLPAVVVIGGQSGL